MDFGNRVNEEAEGRINEENSLRINPDFKNIKNPEWIKDRDLLFDKLYEEQSKLYLNVEKREIDIILKDGTIKKGKAFETTPFDIAKSISKGLLKSVVVAKVKYTNKETTLFNDLCDAEAEFFNENGAENKGELYDLKRPLEGDCTLELLDFENEEAKSVFWHSSAHILGRSMESNYGALLTHGPPVKNGFFYDSFIGNEKVSEKNYKDLEKTAEALIKEDKPFLRLVLKKEDALELFKYNPFKVKLITEKIPNNSLTTAYKCGSLIDLCTGPHVLSTGKIKAFKVMKSSASFWLGNTHLDNLQRIYGVSFPSKKVLNEYLKMLEELAKRDHRNIGEQQNLFIFNKFSPGSAFFMPNGIKIINRILELMRNEYKVRGIMEVNSPNIYNNELWKTSGHYYKYKENMYFIKTKDNEEFGVKPMNCPGHCLMYKNGLHSYRNLPIRYADFGVLHRNEASGALTGLTRVRRFHQDDGHIFCREDQILEEILGTLDLVDYIYKIFNFDYKLELSTKPELHMGDDKVWENAENSLSQALDKLGREWKINQGDGAFYGPKIDIKVLDCYKREHQLATIQLDFNLPERFNLKYKTNEETKHNEENKNDNKEIHEDIEEEIEEDKKDIESQNTENKDLYNKVYKLKHGFKRPIIIHRAVLGSVERCLAILCEHYGGKWPFWMSPNQIMVIPVSDKFLDYAVKVKNRFDIENYYASVDVSNSQLNKKIRNAQIAQFNYILVVGEKEVNDGTVTVRERDAKKEKGTYRISEFLEFLKTLQPEKSQKEKDLINLSFLDNEPINKIKEEDLEKWNSSLDTKLYFGDDEINDQDKEIYSKLKEYEINSKYSNLYKWKLLMKKYS